VTRVVWVDVVEVRESYVDEDGGFLEEPVYDLTARSGWTAPCGREVGRLVMRQVTHTPVRALAAIDDEGDPLYVDEWRIGEVSEKWDRGRLWHVTPGPFGELP
jgi:hypothetical protein